MFVIYLLRAQVQGCCGRQHRVYCVPLSRLRHRLRQPHGGAGHVAGEQRDQPVAAWYQSAGCVHADSDVRFVSQMHLGMPDACRGGCLCQRSGRCRDRDGSGRLISNDTGILAELSCSAEGHEIGPEHWSSDRAGADTLASGADLRKAVYGISARSRKWYNTGKCCNDLMSGWHLCC